MTTRIPVLTILALLSFPFAVYPAAPPYVPVQGVLTDAGGVPIDGEVQVVFAIYPGSGDTALWSETQTVTVEGGHFAVYLGQINPLDLSLFRDNGDLRLGITVGQDQEMQRIPLGSAPFAGYAEYPTDTDTLAGLNCQSGQGAQFNGSTWVCASAAQPSLPSGAVMFFNLPNCPPGFSALPQAAGRYLVGLPAGGALGSQVGTALGDQENRAVGRHGHAASSAPHSHGLPFYNYSNDNYSGTYLMSGIDRGDTLQVTNSADVSVTVEESGTVGGTPAPYLQFTVCVKD